MRPVKMRLSGWGPYREEQKIDFEALSRRGLFLVTGDTGAGKTTVFDALTYALYGEMSGQLREKGSVRSDFADETTKTYVELTMRHRGSTYTILRSPEYLRPKKRKTGADTLVKEKERALLSLPSGEMLEGSSAVTQKIQELLGMDLRQFKQISMLAQGEFARLLTAPPKEKTQIFRDIFETEIYERFARILRERAQELFHTLQSYTHKIEEDIDSFSCVDEEWLTLAHQENISFMAVEDYLQKKTTQLKKESAALEKELAQTEIQLEKTNLKVQELLGIYRLFEETESLSREARQAAPLYEKRKELENWLLLVGEEKKAQSAFSQGQKAADAAKRRMQSTREAYQQAEEAEKETRGRYEAGQSAYRRAAIGIAASMVEEGKPCPVCGSLEHPVIAKCAEGIPDEKELQKLQKKAALASALLKTCYGDAILAKEDLERQTAALTEAEETYLRCQRDCSEAKAACGDVWRQLFPLGVQEGKVQITAPMLEQAGRRLGELLEVYQRADALLSEKKKTLQEKLAAAGLLDVDAVREKEAALDKEKSALSDRKRGLLEQIRKHYALRESAQRVQSSIQEKSAAMEEIKAQYGVVKDLDNLTWGANPKRLVFEQYVLAGYFEDILRAANRRLLGMTGGRYELYRTQEVLDGRSRDNLEIRVLDHYTGRYRSIKTLSGGETFKASLSLALGLSDVIQHRNGGILVECLFIDEGFGALDEESLEQACRTLKELAGSFCMIGIISHVAQLKEQIDDKLIVKRTNYGSSITISTL